MVQTARRRPETFRIDSADLDAVATAAGSTSLIERIFAVVSDAIKERRLEAGMRMPSVRQLADDCGISRDTAARAYDKLVAHGLLESRPRSGYLVKSSRVRKTHEPTLSRRDQAWLFRLGEINRFRFGLIKPPQGLHSNSGTGGPPQDWIDEAGIASALRAVSRSSPRTLSSPGDPQGYLPLRQQIQLKLHDIGVHADPANIILTSGAAGALSLVIQAYLGPGDVVLVEQPCQPLLIGRMMNVGLDFAYVPRRADGPDLTVLRELCERHHPRYFFCQPVLHNPTGRHMAPHVAFQLLKLAEEFDLTLIEDDSDGDLLPQGTGIMATRLAPLDQLQRVIHIGSFSKTLAPSLRVGYLAASSEHAERLSAHRALDCIANSNLSERVAYRLLSEGNYRRHCEQLRSRLADLRPLAVRALRKLGMEIEYEPDAGFYLWADMGRNIDALSFARRMLEQGHFLAPGQLFSMEHDSHLRFNIAMAENQPLLQTLGRALGE